MPKLTVTTKFEVDDLIERNNMKPNRRRVIRVTDSGRIDVRSLETGSVYLGCNPDNYTLIQRAGATDESMAKDLLVSLGYTVESPKPKQSVEVVLYKDGGELIPARKLVYDGWGIATKNKYPVVAIATITEGDGL